MVQIHKLFPFLSILCFVFVSVIHCSQQWPGPGKGPQNLKAFPSKVDCRLEIVFERDESTWSYTVYGLYDKSNGPIELKPFEIQDGTLPITVVNGDSSDDPGIYQELASDVHYTVLVVNKCATDVQHGDFQNQIFIRGNPGGKGGVDNWESDHVLVQKETIPSPGVKLTNVTAEKNLILNYQPGQDLSYTAYLEWSKEKTLSDNEIAGFWAFVGYRGSGQHFIQSLYWPLKDQYGGSLNGKGYVNFKVPANFDFDHDQKFFVAISVQTGLGAFSDPVTCPQQPVTIPK